MHYEVKENAYAKLNISLDVGKKRDDGYHEMNMVMQTVSLCDRLTLVICDEPGITLSCNLPYIPTGENNLAYKAAKLYIEKTGFPYGVKIDIEKNIPVGAGMAGGSTDAAAVLRVLNRANGNTLDKNSLLGLACSVGSDVAFCLFGGTKLATGRGEVLTPLHSFPDCSIVIAKPDFSISTPEFFKLIDKKKLEMHPDTNGLIAALDREDLTGVARRMYNVFEDIGDRRLSVVREVKDIMIDAGALGAVMTGTGSAVFGVFTSGSECDELVSDLKKKYGFCVKAKPVNELSGY